MKSNLPIIPRSASMFLLVLLLLLSPQSTVHAAKFPSSSYHSRKILNNADHPDAAAPAVAFRPRRRGGGAVGSSASSPSTASLAMRRRRANPEDGPSRSFPDTTDAVRTVSSRRRRGGKEDSATTARGEEPQPTLEELRAALGPAGLFAAGAMELAVVTLGSYVSGAFLGYVGGGIMGIPSTLFGGGASAGGAMRRLQALHAKAAASCASWAALSASFSGFNALVRLCRGEEEDGGNWNAVIGSAMTGAFLNRAGGPEAMLRGGATYAGFTYVLDRFFKSPSSTAGGNSRRSSELAYTDVPVDDDDDVAFF